jgi:hypothetical protein
MEESMREKIALFRYGLIAPLINGQVDRAAYLAEVSSKKHQVPLYGEKTYAVKTVLECWLFYRREGFDGLKPGTRSDRGKSRTLSEEQQTRMRMLRNQHAEMPVTVFYETMSAQGELMPSEVSYATLHRFLSHL